MSDLETIEILLPPKLAKFVSLKLKETNYRLSADCRFGALIKARLVHSFYTDPNPESKIKVTCHASPRCLNGIGGHFTRASFMALEKELEYMLKDELYHDVIRFKFSMGVPIHKVILNFYERYNLCEEDWKLSSARKMIDRRLKKELPYKVR